MIKRKGGIFMGEEIITKMELKEAKEQKRKFIEETDHYEEEVYQQDKALIYYSQVTLNNYVCILEFVKGKFNNSDFNEFTVLWDKFNIAIFDEYERLNYLYYKLGKNK